MPDSDEVRQQIYEALDALSDEAIRRLWRFLQEWIPSHVDPPLVVLSLGSLAFFWG